MVSKLHGIDSIHFITKHLQEHDTEVNEATIVGWMSRGQEK